MTRHRHAPNPITSPSWIGTGTPGSIWRSFTDVPWREVRSVTIHVPPLRRNDAWRRETDRSGIDQSASADLPTINT